MFLILLNMLDQVVFLAKLSAGLLESFNNKIKQL